MQNFVDNAGSPRFQVKIIRTEEALAQIECEWDALCTSDPDADPFASARWFANWWRHFGGRPGEAALVVNDGTQWVPISGSEWRMNVLVVHDSVEHETLAVLPMVSVRGRFKRWRGRILATPVNNHGPRAAVAARRFDRPVVEALCDALVSDRSWDLLMLEGLSATDARVTDLVAALRARRLATFSEARWQQAFLRHPGSFGSLLADRSRQFRKHFRQNERSLEKLGTVRVDTFTGEAAREGFRQFVEIDAASWKASGGENLARAPEVLAYYHDLVTELALTGQAEVWTLSIAGQPAAAFLCLCDHQVRYCLKTSFRQQYSGSTRISPSQVLLGRIIEHSADHDAKDVDFMGSLPFVDRWADRKLERTHLVLARALPVRLLRRFGQLFFARTTRPEPSPRTDR